MENYKQSLQILEYFILSNILKILIFVLLPIKAHGLIFDESPFFDNTRLSVDLSTYGFENTDTNSSWDMIYFIGVDLHRVFSNTNRDIATVVFQPYWKKVENSNAVSDDNWDLTWRIANINFNPTEIIPFNIKVGHFEIPFGLEKRIDTNGTLRQYTFPIRNIKADWGISFHKVKSQLNYEIAMTRGTGNDYRSRLSPYIISGRVGTSTHKNLIVGASFFEGKVLTDDFTTQHTHIGFDFTYFHNNFEYLLEISGGDSNGKPVDQSLLEVSYRNANERFHHYVQFFSDNLFSNTTSTKQHRWVIGAAFNSLKNIELGLQLTKTINTIEDTSFLMTKFRWRF